jgi:hypothetical protein
MRGETRKQLDRGHKLNKNTFDHKRGSWIDLTNDIQEDFPPIFGFYSCLLCDEPFSMKRALNSHYRHAHKI